MDKDSRNEIIETILAEIAAKSKPTAVSVNEKIKRKYWMWYERYST